MELRIPIDSAGYMSMINAEGEQLTEWKKLDEIKTNLIGDYHLAKKWSWGIVDEELNFLVEPKYSKIQVHGDYIYAERVGHLTIYDLELKLVKEFDQFDGLEFLYEYSLARWATFGEIQDRLIVKTREGCVILNEDLSLASEQKFEDAFGMNGIIYLRDGDRFGFVSDEEKVFEPKWTSISTFDSWVMELTDESGHRHYICRNGFEFPHSDSTLISFPKFREYKVYQNGKGKIVDPFEERQVSYQGEDIFPVSTTNNGDLSDWKIISRKYAVKQNGKIGLIDQNGNMLISPRFDQIEAGNDETLIYMKGMKFGLMTQSGSIIFDTLFTYISHEREGYFAVYDQGKKGVVDSEGNTIVPIGYSDVNCDGPGVVTLDNGKWGFYTYDGKEWLKPEHYKLTNENGGLEYINARGRVMVSAKGLITPKGCDRITKVGRNLKYYKGDHIVHCELDEEGAVIDTTIYPRPRSIRITRDDGEYSYSLSDANYAFIRSQLNGKVGSISKHGKGYGVKPIFDNTPKAGGPAMGIVQTEDFYRLDYALLVAKEKLVPFYPSSGRTYEEVFAYFTAMPTYSWHSDKYDPVIKKDKKIRFYTQNNYYSESNFLHPRKGRSSKALVEGSVGFSDGKDFLSFKDYYRSVNSYHNLKIESKTIFSLLSTNPELKVSEDGVWKVNTFIKGWKIGLSDQFRYYEEYNSKYAVASKDGERFGVVKDGESYHVPLKCSKIEPVQIGETTYFKVEMQDESAGGLSDWGWTIYDDEGRVFGELYDEVEVLGWNIFKLVRGDTYLIVDKSGQEIYRSRPGFLVEN